MAKKAADYDPLAYIPATPARRVKSFDDPLDGMTQAEVAKVTGRKGGKGGTVRKTIFLDPSLIAEIDDEAERGYGDRQKMKFWEWLVKEGWRQYQMGARPKIAQVRQVKEIE